MQSDNGWFLSHLCHYCTSISCSLVTDVDCRVVADLVVTFILWQHGDKHIYLQSHFCSLNIFFFDLFLRHCFIMYLRLALNQDLPVSLLRLGLPDMCQHSQLLTLFCLFSKHFLNVWYLPDDTKYGTKKNLCNFLLRQKKCLKSSDNVADTCEED